MGRPRKHKLQEVSVDKIDKVIPPIVPTAEPELIKVEKSSFDMEASCKFLIAELKQDQPDEIFLLDGILQILKVAPVNGFFVLAERYIQNKEWRNAVNGIEAGLRVWKEKK